jgi:integrase/recombinase XerD
MENHGLRANPCATITIERNEDAGAVEYYTVEDAQAIMDLSMTKRFLSILPYHAICLFSGVRAAECERLTWDNIDFEDKSIVLEKFNSKTAGRRPEMQPNLVAWLKWFREKYPQYPLIPSKGFDDKKRQFRKNLSIKWLKNGLRHSAASYTLGAGIGDGYAYLEQHFGNSRTILQQHYLNYPPKEVSLQFWNITPAGLTENT